MDERSWDRHVIRKEVVCIIEGLRDVAFVYDLSAGGCMIEVPHDAVRPGDCLCIELGEFETARGVVVWRSGSCAGVRFEAPVHEAIVIHMGFVPTITPFDNQLPRDRFGRSLPPLGGGERRHFGI